MKIQLACLLLVLLSATELCKALDFYQKHVVDRMDPEKCNEKMKIINGATGGTKPINTFMLISKEMADSICADKSNGFVFTDNQLMVVNCRYKNGKYEGSIERAMVEIKCQNQKPVHLEQAYS